MPNPFYQIYEGAALLAGAEPVYLTRGKKPASCRTLRSAAEHLARLPVAVPVQPRQPHRRDHGQGLPRTALASQTSMTS